MSNLKSITLVMTEADSSFRKLRDFLHKHSTTNMKIAESFEKH